MRRDFFSIITANPTGNCKQQAGEELVHEISYPTMQRQTIDLPLSYVQIAVQDLKIKELPSSSYLHYLP